jgi:deoxyxylulose-5-phosphate synthase
MLTGRWDRIHTIRQYEGLNGFCLRSESEHDCYGAGHAGTALSRRSAWPRRVTSPVARRARRLRGR